MLFKQNKFSKKNKKIYMNRCCNLRDEEYFANNEEEYDFKTQRFE